MCKIICLVNVKGGVGKTSSTVNIGAVLSENKRVLIVDLDPSSNTTQYLNRYDKSGVALSTYDILIKPNININDVIVKTDIKNMDILPSNIKLTKKVEEILLDENRPKEYRLKEALKPIINNYDYILIDAPPCLTVLTTNALVASDYILVPIRIDLFALDGFNYLLDEIESVKSEFNPNLKLLGAFITIFEKRHKTSKEVRAYLQTELGNILLDTYIRKNVAVVDSTFRQIPVVISDKRASATIDYKNLVMEVLTHVE